MTPTLPIHPLQADTFAPYGQVLPLGAAPARRINGGTSTRLDLPSSLDLHREGGQPVLAVFRAQAQAAHGPWQTLERHRLGTQSFVPLQALRWLVLVARGADAPDPGTLAAFEATPGQGITLWADTWHHPLIALEAGDFLVLERGGAAVDCELAQLADPVRLAWA